MSKIILRKVVDLALGYIRVCSTSFTELLSQNFSVENCLLLMIWAQQNLWCILYKGLMSTCIYLLSLPPTGGEAYCFCIVTFYICLPQFLGVLFNFLHSLEYKTTIDNFVLFTLMFHISDMLGSSRKVFDCRHTYAGGICSWYFFTFT